MVESGKVNEISTAILQIADFKIFIPEHLLTFCFGCGNRIAELLLPSPTAFTAETWKLYLWHRFSSVMKLYCISFTCSELTFLQLMSVM